MTLVLTADASSYAQLPIFEDAIEAFAALTSREALLSGCETLVRVHGLGDIVGVDIKHKHFDLPTGALLVERQNIAGLSAVMKPETTSDAIGTLTPCAFFFSDARWQPHEYVLDSPEAEVALEKVLAAPNFLDALADLLRGHAAAGYLGFHFLHRGFLGSSTIETPGESPHELLLRPDTEELRKELLCNPKDVQQVAWAWGSKGPIGHHCIVCRQCQHCIAHR
jgi:hypothetical protein